MKVDKFKVAAVSDKKQAISNEEKESDLKEIKVEHSSIDQDAK
jgi:hypothetical protein